VKVFISWSGEHGKAIAKILHVWLPAVLQAVKPFFSPDDIVKGARWAGEVSAELDSSQVGIIVVTRDSLSSPWVMFESGALSKNIGKSKVVPILVDLRPEDIHGPLTQFQCALLDSADMKRLLRMLNSELRDLSLTDDVLESAFSMWWPTLERQVRSLTRTSDHAPSVRRSERDLLEEILSLARSLAERSTDAPASLDANDEHVARFSGTLTLSSVRKRLKAGGNLVGANLMNLNLARENLGGANLAGANLVGVNLSHASLVDADLTGANLEGAVLDDADFAGTVLAQANLWRASMRNARNLSSAKSLEDANFYEVDLDDSDRQLVAAQKTVSLGTYPNFFEYFRKKGMTTSQLRDTFLWTAHAYPGEAF
jgi:uncharacterized protein YjbI with pentapeptide repeats